jgi:hypothetical protein
MRMSDKKRSQLYEAISKPIMDERIMVRNNGTPDAAKLDDILFWLELDIWKKVHEVLELDGPA